ncbi:MAG: cation:proton antiporter [Lachnospiraceae bacterium]|nr:cation:proton antiporter [Lachnospiraceae bacterium]
MAEYEYLLDIAIILAATKVLSLFSKRVNLPAVVGSLLAGIILGPVLLNIVQPSETLTNLAELGVIVLMFEAGLETDLNELKKCGLAAFIIALLGVLVPLITGGVIMYIFEKNVMQAIFAGTILTATSVSITVDTLQEMGKLKGKAGTAILGAAIIDDILGIVLLSLITSIGGSGNVDLGSIVFVLIKMALFFVLAGVTGLIAYRFFIWLMPRNEARKRRIPVLAFAYCLVLAYCSEMFGIADITGAYIAGVFLCNLSQSDYIHSKVEVVSYMLITPVFFASIGLKVTVDGMTPEIIILTVVISIAAVLTKIIGCGIGAKVMKYTNREALQIGMGMVCRGEVALIVANKGMKVNLMDAKYFSPMVIMVVVTTLITPILLKFAFYEKNSKKSGAKRPAKA